MVDKCKYYQKKKVSCCFGHSRRNRDLKLTMKAAATRLLWDGRKPVEPIIAPSVVKPCAAVCSPTVTCLHL